MMKIMVNSIAVEGTPKEVFELISLMGQQPPKPATSTTSPFKPYTYIGTPSTPLSVFWTT